MQMFTAISPNLLVADVEQSIAFYALLGFEMLARVPENGKPQFAIVKEGAVSIMLQDKKSVEADLPFRFTQNPPGGVLLYMDVENVEEIRSRIDGKAQIVKDIHSTFYGTNELVISDPDQFLLVFAEDQKKS
jgi:uncharacterized glyoxalase superfamily protein PhnB